MSECVCVCVCVVFMCKCATLRAEALPLALAGCSSSTDTICTLTPVPPPSLCAGRTLFANSLPAMFATALASLSATPAVSPLCLCLHVSQNCAEQGCTEGDEGQASKTAGHVVGGFQNLQRVCASRLQMLRLAPVTPSGHVTTSPGNALFSPAL